MPRVTAAVCGSKFLDPWRDNVCQGLSGDIVEIGFGSGSNVHHLPWAVRHVHGVEPSGAARARRRDDLEWRDRRQRHRRTRRFAAIR